MTGAARLDLEEIAALTGSAAVGIGALAVVYLSVLTSRLGLGTPSFARALRLALTTIAVGAMLSAAQLAIRGAQPFPTTSVSLMIAAAAVAVVISRHPVLGEPHERARAIFDAAIAALSLFVVIWLMLGRAAHATGVNTTGEHVAAAALTVASVLFFGVARTGAAITLQREPNSSAESGAALMLLGFVLLSVGSAVLIVRFTGVAEAGATASGYLLLTAAVGAFAAAAAAMLDPSLPRVHLHRQALKAWLDLSPVVLAFSAFAAAILDTLMHRRLDTTGVIVAVAVVAAVLVRQAIMLADNRQLAATLRASVRGLELQAGHDPLTGLPNRSRLHQRVDDALAAAEQAGTRCAVFFVDLDRLKAVNDSLGHAAGDIMLRNTASRLRSRVGPHVSRFGGDEFVVVVSDLPSVMAAERFGHLLVQDMEEPLTIEGQQVGSSASVGLAIAQRGCDAEELLRRADVALYRAKARGRRCLVTYSAADDPELRAGVAVRRDLVRAVERDELTLHYQPVVRLDTGEVARFEALIRWQHPERGLLTPFHFLDAAADAGLLGTIGGRSLATACADFASLAATVDDDGRLVPPPGVAVNLSSSELVDSRAVTRVAEALARSSLEPRRMTIEITEDVIVDQGIRDTIDAIRALGVHLAIDDFGTGWSSLQQLGVYPAEVLKIDKAFVDHIVDDEAARSVLATVVQLANELGLTTVAEGVETVDQCRVLTAMGCDMAQGWLFAKAMPFDAAVRWMRSGPPLERAGVTDAVSSSSEA